MATKEDYVRLGIPTLVLVGDGDKVTPMADAVEIYKTLPQGHGPCILQDASHSLMLEKAELLNTLISEFLREKCKIGHLE